MVVILFVPAVDVCYAYLAFSSVKGATAKSLIGIFFFFNFFITLQELSLLSSPFLTFNIFEI